MSKQSDRFSSKGADPFIRIVKEANMGELNGPIAYKSAAKRIVYGPVLVPGEPDHEGEVLTAEKIEDVAFKFMEDFRYIDLSHTLQEVGRPVASHILDRPQTFAMKDGSVLSLPQGTWMLGIRVRDDKSWERVLSGELRGFSIMGVKRSAYDAIAAKSAGAVPIGHKWEDGELKKIRLQDLGDDWLAVAVSILANPSVFKSRFVSVKGADDSSLLSRILSRFNISKASANNNPKNHDGGEPMALSPDDMKAVAAEVVKQLKEQTDKPADETPPPAKADDKPTTPPAPEAKADEKVVEPPKPEAGADSKVVVGDFAPPAKVEPSAEVAELKAELSAVKGKLEDQSKLLDKVGKFAESAVKSQGLLGDYKADDAATKAGTDGAPTRDLFGRVVKPAKR